MLDGGEEGSGAAEAIYAEIETGLDPGEQGRHAQETAAGVTIAEDAAEKGHAVTLYGLAEDGDVECREVLGLETVVTRYRVHPISVFAEQAIAGGAQAIVVADEEDAGDMLAGA